MTCFLINPLTDSRWDRFLACQTNASVFHTRSWLQCLRTVYGYEPIAVTESQPGAPLDNAIVFCHVASWLSGNRLVSLPFSDHCNPLLNNPEQLTRLAAAAQELASQRHCRYIELRPLQAIVGSCFVPSATSCFHELDLAPGPEALYRNLHKDCIQRKIRKAQKEKLDFSEGNSAELIQQFYKMHTQTRLRHGLPPQPLAWFESLLTEFADNAMLRVAYLRKLPIASIVTLKFKDTTVYKYGCSIEKYHSLGAMQALMWAAIEEACHRGHASFDMGRSDQDQTGLIEYKDRWGAKKSLIHYYRFPNERQNGTRSASGTLGIARKVFLKMPEGAAQLVGRLIYRHLG